MTCINILWQDGLIVYFYIFLQSETRLLSKFGMTLTPSPLVSDCRFCWAPNKIYEQPLIENWDKFLTLEPSVTPPGVFTSLCTCSPYHLLLIFFRRSIFRFYFRTFSNPHLSLDCAPPTAGRIFCPPSRVDSRTILWDLSRERGASLQGGSFPQSIFSQWNPPSWCSTLLIWNLDIFHLIDCSASAVCSHCQVGKDQVELKCLWMALVEV